MVFILIWENTIKGVKKANRLATRNFSFLVCFLMMCNLVVAIPVSSKNDQKALTQYYHTLETIVDDNSLEEQIFTLQNFVKRFPDFERGYLRLLEKYTISEKLQEATNFFAELADKKSYERNSHWMLAKIHLLEKDPHNALRAFTLAIRADPPTPELLKDFLKFDTQHFNKFHDSTFVNSIGLTPEDKKIADLFLSYQKLDYQNSIQQLEQLPRKLSHNLVMLYLWGRCHYGLAQYEQAESKWRNGLDLAQKTKDMEFEAKYLIGLGILPENYQTPTGLSYFDSAYTIAHRIGDLSNMAYLAGNRGQIYKQRGKYALAEKLILEAIQISTKLKDDRNAAKWHFHYGNLLFYMNRFDEALKSYDRSEEMAIKSKNQRTLIQVLLDKGTLYRHMAQNELARLSYKEAYNLANIEGLAYHKRNARIGQADIYFEEGKYNKAREIYQEYIDLTHERKGYSRERSYWFIKNGRAYLLEKDFQSAREEFLQGYKAAQEARYDHNMVWALIYLAEIDFLTDKLPEAEKNYQSCLQLIRTKKDSSTLPTIYLGLGNVHKKAGDRKKAVSNYLKAAEIIEKTREHLQVEEFRIGYFVNASQVYDKLADCYFQIYQQEKNQSYLDSLYHYIEMSRGRALRDSKRQRNITIRGKKSKQYAAYLNLSNELELKQRDLREKARHLLSPDEWNKVLSEINLARHSLVAQRLRLMDEKPISDHARSLQVHALSSTRKHLKTNNLGLLLYHISEDISFVLTAAKGEVKLVPLEITGAALTAAVNSLIAPFHQLDEKFIEETPFKAEIAHQLYCTLIKAVEDSLTLPKNLLVIPDIELMNLPFEMLLVNAPDKSVYFPKEPPIYAKHFLQHRYTIVYSPTTALLEETSKWRFAKPDVLVFANPVEDTVLSRQKQTNSAPTSSKFTQNHTMRQLHFRTGWRLHPLPFSEIEAKKIQGIDRSVKVYKKSIATKETFTKEAPKADVIHLATHAFADTTYDAFCGLVLATSDDSTDDGLLMGYEISDLNLNCDLIALSACETGRGKLVVGEGILGLPRLFISAGAKSVLLTRWKVDDLFSSQLMPEFYEQYLNNNLSKAEALAEAKRIMLNSEAKGNGFFYQHPLFWASFTLFGDPGQKHINLSVFKIIMFLLAIVLLTFMIWITYYRIRKSHRKTARVIYS